MTGFDLLGRYPISVILSFLQECDGVSLLITKRRLTLTILPIFRLRGGERGLGLVVVTSTARPLKHRHQFVVYAAQDPQVLLERINTKRLRRTRPPRNKTTGQLAAEEQFNNDPPLLRFLTPHQDDATTLLVSYPRSGNTLVRTLLERVTGIVTGSDTRPDRKLSRDLGFVGEGVTNRVHFLKTHFPERSGVRPIRAKRAILLVRNPYDAIDSYWNLNLTNTHTETVTDAIYQQYAETFADFSRNECKVWNKFHQYWFKAPVPVLVVRFEDLLTNMVHELTRVIRFALSTNHEEYMQRIDQVCKDINPSKMGSYRPRASGKILYGKALAKGRYTPEVIRDFHVLAAKHGAIGYETLLQRCGYDMLVQNFPDKCVVPVPLGVVGRHDVGGSILLNDGSELRERDDPFGRVMKQWRLDRTNNDTEPFPIAQRSS